METKGASPSPEPQAWEIHYPSHTEKTCAHILKPYKQENLQSYIVGFET